MFPGPKSNKERGKVRHEYKKNLCAVSCYLQEKKLRIKPTDSEDKESIGEMNYGLKEISIKVETNVETSSTLRVQHRHNKWTPFMLTFRVNSHLPALAVIPSRSCQHPITK